MERRLAKKVDNYTDETKTALIECIQSFKTSTVDLVKDDELNTFNINLDEIIKCVNGIKPVSISKEDFLKRKRTKNSVVLSDRCCACRANGEQCSRRKKDNSNYCGTHIKGIPHGVIKQEDSKTNRKKEVWCEDIGGIYQYIDNDLNVYKHEDVMNNLINPAIIGKCIKNELDGKLTLVDN
tara:strand:- start:510 stop:1052 length:543 start_codon:yes stop_codon:yes gene_type:complete